MQGLKIVLLGVAAAVIYGVLHDQVTARICVEYFTIGHPPIFATQDPTLLALAWGVSASWWVGLLLGVGLALVARFGRRPRRSAGPHVRPVAGLMGVTACGALLAGVVGWLLAQRGSVFLVEPLASEVPADRQAVFLADAWAHSASYLVGLVGGNVMLIRVWLSRSSIVEQR
jgi:hypothetical protein